LGKYINFNQIAIIIKRHFIVSIATMFFGIILPVFLINGVKEIASLIAMFIYVLVLYSTSLDIARQDSKQYTYEAAYPWKGLILPLGIYVVWGFLYILFHVSWKYGIVHPDFVSGLINNILFVMWNYVYMGFMQIIEGKFAVWTLLLVFLVPLVSCGIGYFAGYKGFDISEKVVKIVYDEKDEEESGEDE